MTALARERLGPEIEPFGLVLGVHFLSRYPQVRRATIRLAQHRWERLHIDGQPHPHSFSDGGRARPWAEVACGSTLALMGSIALRSAGWAEGVAP